MWFVVACCGNAVYGWYMCLVCAFCGCERLCESLRVQCVNKTWSTWSQLQGEEITFLSHIRMLTVKGDLFIVVVGDITHSRRNCTFQELQVWGENIGPDYTYDHTSRMFFPNEYYTNFVSKLWLYDCQICRKPKKNQKELEAHLKADHERCICHSCAKNKQVFPSEIKYYTQVSVRTSAEAQSGQPSLICLLFQAALEKHLRHGDPDEGGQGHPLCQFCRTRFYDKQTLYEHLNKNHYSCHLCEKKGVSFLLLEQMRYFSCQAATFR